MKKYLVLFSVLLFFVSGFAKNKIESNSKFSEITITMKDGQVKSGKVKHPFDLNKKIVLISDSGEKVNVDVTLIDEVALKHENGVNLTFKNVYYYNHSGKKINKKPKLMLVVMKEVLTLYFDNGVSYTNMMSYGVMTSTNYNNYYAIREGEDAAKIISGYVNGQVNPNVMFKVLASRYFEDYPELSKKIKDKVYRYTDIITVALEYIKWKKSKN